jgi:uncharacterized membrane protein YphA (DoxX/SURF4 family)
MDYLMLAVQILVALVIYNVWFLRAHRSTSYRGGDAQNMREEFAVYGLPGWFMNVVFVLKVACATALILGIWWPTFTLPGAIGMVALMAGAVAMHVKVSDTVKKTAPAFTMMTLSALILVYSL